ncbi:unnamed protein product, partial [Didymodactylos carnosus]
MTTGPLLIHQVTSGVSVDSIYYRDECVKPLIKKLLKKRPSSGTNDIKFHHDSPKDIVVNYLHKEKIKIMAYPPYSFDLAPCLE